MIPFDYGGIRRSAGGGVNTSGDASLAQSPGGFGGGANTAAAGAFQQQQQTNASNANNTPQGPSAPPQMYEDLGNMRTSFPRMGEPGASLATLQGPGGSVGAMDPSKTQLLGGPVGGDKQQQCEIRYIPVLVQKPQQQQQQKQSQQQQPQEEQPQRQQSPQPPQHGQQPQQPLGQGQSQQGQPPQQQQQPPMIPPPGAFPLAGSASAHHPALMSIAARQQQLAAASAAIQQQQHRLNQQQQLLNSPGGGAFGMGPMGMGAMGGMGSGMGPMGMGSMGSMGGGYPGAAAAAGFPGGAADPLSSSMRGYASADPMSISMRGYASDPMNVSMRGLAAAASVSAPMHQMMGAGPMITQNINTSDVVLNDGNRDEAALAKRPGNHLFNSVVREHRYAYWQAASNEKLIVAKRALDEMLEDNPTSRFWVPNEDGSYRAATFEDTLRAICKSLDDGKSKALRAMQKGRTRQLDMDGHVEPSTNPRTAMQTGDKIKEPHDNDVLLGRGKFASEHPGNILFRQIVWEMKEEYYISRKSEKTKMVQRVIDRIKTLNPPGRFLEKGEDLLFRDAPQDRVILKVSQALRERRWFESEKDATFRQDKKRRRTTKSDKSDKK